MMFRQTEPRRDDGLYASGPCPWRVRAFWRRTPVGTHGAVLQQDKARLHGQEQMLQDHQSLAMVYLL